MEELTYRIGIDVGGTFTDAVAFASDGSWSTFKSPSTPDAPADGVLAALADAAAWAGCSPEQFLGRCRYIVHGTTVGTNAVLQRRGASVGLITTAGFRDMLETWWKPRERYDIRYPMLRPLVPRRLRLEVRERTGVGGEEVVPLHEADVEAAVAELREQGVDAIAISFLFSFLEPAHEQEAERLVRELWPEVPVYASSRILPQVGDFQRTTDTILAAYTGARVGPYLRNLGARLGEGGFAGDLLIMQAGGGVVPFEAACENSLGTINSGPAGGPAAAIWHARKQGVDNALLTDMGGTSFDCTLIEGGQVPTSRNTEIGGYPLAFPAVDVQTIGAGGGSIASVDRGGRLRVGPQSAGASPGPASYGRGGELPTVTDANVVLGYLEPSYFRGGREPLDVEAAKQALETHVGGPLGLDATAAAAAVHSIVNHTMADAIRSISVERGHDPRESLLVCAGGAGALHAASLAAELEIDRVLIPRMASVFCAFGMLITDMRFDFVRTYYSDLAEADPAQVDALLEEMAASGREQLVAAGHAAEAVLPAWSADMRYAGQVHDVEVGFAGHPGSGQSFEAEAVAAAFHRRHEELYDYSDDGSAIEMVNLWVKVAAPGAGVPAAVDEAEPAGGTRGTRAAHFPQLGGMVEVTAVRGEALGAGDQLAGPALIDDVSTTIVVPPGWTLLVDADGDRLLERNADDAKGMV